MSIIYLTAGAGGMYCGTCLQANALATALRRAGQDVLLMPVYTPIRSDEDSVSIDRVAFGGINVYLQEHSAIFRHTPWFLDRILDRPGLLRRLASRSSTVDPAGLGALCVSMLRGEQGRQRKELRKLVHWLHQLRPRLVHLSTALLAGMAREIRRELGIPVISSLSGEDAFVERLPEPHRTEARNVLRERAADLAALIAPSRYFAEFMAEYLAVPRERIHVVLPGLNLSGHAPREIAAESAASDVRSTVKIGYFGRICEDKGLHHLVEAFQMLCRQREFPPLRLEMAGYLSEADRPYLAGLETSVRQSGLTDRFHYHGELDREAKLSFLRSLDVFCMPSVYREPKALPALEGWANGVPAVLPAHGAFPELVEETAGGLLFEPGNAASLAGALKELIANRQQAIDLGRRARDAICDRFSIERMAQQVIAVYESAQAP